jgi:hypothetical protein
VARIVLTAGQRFGRLTAVEKTGERIYSPCGQYKPLWVFRCDCGQFRTLTPYNVTNGGTRSCGCLKREEARTRFITHGATTPEATPEMRRTWRSYVAMKTRCSNPKRREWADYGGRGIRICRRWIGRYGFAHFLADMGLRPAGTSLDRIDVDKNYGPSNCRWADAATQSQNRRPSCEWHFESADEMIP